MCAFRHSGFQKSSKKYQTFQGGTSAEQDAPRTSFKKIVEETSSVAQGSSGSIQQVPESAFSTISEPFDSNPAQHAALDMTRDDSSVMSSNPRQNSGQTSSTCKDTTRRRSSVDASSNSSVAAGIKTQHSGTSFYSERDGWTEEADSPRVINRIVHGRDRA